MPSPVLPLEIRAKIYLMLEDWHLAKSLSEVFWAISPHYLRDLCIGDTFGNSDDRLQTILIEKFPDSGNFVEILSIVTDNPRCEIITKFLQLFPLHRKLKHLRLVYSLHVGAVFFLEKLKYEHLLTTLLLSSPDITRLSFYHFQPSFELILSCADRLTRLDIGHIHAHCDEIDISLISHLEVLSFTPDAATHFTGTPPQTLLKLIIKADDLSDSFLNKECEEFVGKCTSVRSLAIVDDCEFFYFLQFPFISHFSRSTRVQSYYPPTHS